MYQYQVSFKEAIQRAFNNYCNFSGRASRSEYWWFQLFTTLVSWVLSIIGVIIFGTESAAASLFTYIWGFAILLPQLGLLFRRLHDTGRSGWNWCWSFLPIIGWIILLVYLCQDSQMQDNQYGPVPNLRY
ncbi:MAG: DUF805 domain-containing protein [Muribaculaceae bacterium]|nr:DUF805 domain-containing protein [Muribaculaceae bacterium]MDE6538112.1 DUF805 domain-containing protein [Muribaculaceae bacterium]